MNATRTTEPNMETKSASLTVNCFGKGGKLLLGNVEVKSMNEARSLAAQWNKDNNVSRIEVIWGSNGMCGAVY